MNTFALARRRTAALIIGVGSVLSLVSVPGQAAAAPMVPDAVRTEARALVAARAGGKSVLVMDRTDENTDVRANPDGTLT